MVAAHISMDSCHSRVSSVESNLATVYCATPSAAIHNIQSLCPPELVSGSNSSSQSNTFEDGHPLCARSIVRDLIVTRAIQ